MVHEIPFEEENNHLPVKDVVIGVAAETYVEQQLNPPEPSTLEDLESILPLCSPLPAPSAPPISSAPTSSQQYKSRYKGCPPPLPFSPLPPFWKQLHYSFNMTCGTEKQGQDDVPKVTQELIQ